MSIPFLPLLIFGTVLIAAALALFFIFVLSPASRSISQDRRRPGAASDPTMMGRVTQTTVSAVDDALGRGGGPYNREVLYNAGVHADPASFTVMVACAAAALGVLMALITNGLFGVLFAVATPLAVRAGLAVLTDKRRGKFEAQLTDTIQMLIGGLRVGHSILRSIEAAATEAEAPTSEELGRIVNETRIGKDLRLALDEAAARMDSDDFHWIGQAIQINREVGGDLVDVLEQVAATIRERSEIKGHVRALTGEGKLSAYILMAMPVFIAVVVTFINPGYTDVFFTEPIGFLMVVASLVMFAVGGFWMSRVIKIKF